MKYIILNKNKNSKKIKTLIKKLNLSKCIENKRTTIWQNGDIQISIDKSIIRILIYSINDVEDYSKKILCGK